MLNKLIRLIKKYLLRLKEHDLSAWAAKLTFFILLSIFPFLIFLMEIIHRMHIQNTENLYELTQFFPPEIIRVFQLIIQDISSAKTSSSLLSVAIIAAIWSASRGVLAIIGGLNVAYKQQETRSYIYLRALSLIYTVAFAFIILMTLGLVVFGSRILQLLVTNIPVLVEMHFIIDLLRLLFSVVLSFLFFIMLYNATPNRKITFKAVIPGSILATISWTFVSFFFSLYVNVSKSLSYMYGSLAGVILLLLWLYSTSIIIMLGGELNALLAEE
ncbi:MAG: YihY/virulence factor BrkB family protein [Vallitaleaceae bacterium]|nr:YihY/virulence factor BrkB family protein [Vallitaleaceae bacterium]